MKKNYAWLNHVLNFLAVILGVYLAFYVNDRAKQAEENNEKRAFLNLLSNDLADDIKTYQNYQIPTNEAYLERVDSLLVAVSNKQMAQIDALLPYLFQVENYIPTTSTYASMKSSGKMRLIGDLTLQKRLNDYYDGLVLECTEKNKIQVDYFMGEVVKCLTLQADFEEMKLLGDEDLVVFKNILLIYESLVHQKIRNYEMIVEESTLLKETVDGYMAE